MSEEPSIELPANLKRRLGLPLLVLYGVGITVGAGIYVLVGAVAGHAGQYAPWSFVVAALVMGLTVASYAELSTRIPVSAGEAAYVRAAFHSPLFARLTGLLTIAVGVVSSAAVSLGSAGYVQQFIDAPRPVIVVVTVLLLSAVSAWGILESVVLASIFTLIETGGLLAIIAGAIYGHVPFVAILQQPPPLDPGVLSSIAFAGLLAFFAFIGFEDLANIVEEAKVPHRDIPRAMVLTLAISTVLYVFVSAIAVTAIPPGELARSVAPLSLIFQRVAGIGSATISAIAIVATLNTILAQMTMAARVVYGMARQGDLPRIAGHVHPRTATPVLATTLIAAATIALSLTISLERLAESTSLATLVVFALVNLSLLRLRHRRLHTPGPHVKVPIWVPVAGLMTCLAMIASALLG
jgi:APA family basic amino acid/polyamine antiporter